MSASGFDRIAPEVRQSLADGCLNSLAAPLYLAHEHRALDRRDAEVSHVLRIGLLDKLSLGLFSDEERRQLVFNDFENEADVLANQFIIHSRFVP